MAQYARTPDLLQQVAQLRERLEALERRAPAVRDEVPFGGTGTRSMAFDDRTVFVTVWEAAFTPRGAKLSLGLIFLGDNTGGINTAGEWQVTVNGVVAAGGGVPASGASERPEINLDLIPYQGAATLTVVLQTRRTSGATTGGRYGTGGCIGSGIRYARIT